MVCCHSDSVCAGRATHSDSGCAQCAAHSDNSRAWCAVTVTAVVHSVLLTVTVAVHDMLCTVVHQATGEPQSTLLEPAHMCRVGCGLEAGGVISCTDLFIRSAAVNGKQEWEKGKLHDSSILSF